MDTTAEGSNDSTSELEEMRKKIAQLDLEKEEWVNKLRESETANQTSLQSDNETLRKENADLKLRNQYANDTLSKIQQNLERFTPTVKSRFQLPVKSNEELNAIEEWLAEDKNRISSFAWELLRNADTPYTLASRIMQTLLDDKVASSYSLKGTKDKTSFVELKTYAAIKSAIRIRFPDATEKEITSDMNQAITTALGNMGTKAKKSEKNAQQASGSLNKTA